MTGKWHRRASSVLLLVLAGGCAHGAKPGPLAPQFGTSPRSQKPMSTDPMSGADQPGQLYDNARVDLLPTDIPAKQTPPPVQGLSRTVQDNVTAPGADRPAAATATTAPTAATPSSVAAADAHATTSTVSPNVTTPSATAPAAASPIAAGARGSKDATTIGASSGQYLTLGGVVGEVNGTPIYANKVLSLIEPVLSARAKELSREQFYGVAQKEVTQQMLALRNLELEYAAAERNLEQKDKDLADNLTVQWKNREITAAGGSLELAKNKAKAAGDDFDDLVKQQYRVIMSQIYYQKKVYPRIQVSAADMRDYYDHNGEREFNERGKIRFLLIKISARKQGSREAALDRITGLRNRIVKAGQPFDAMARSMNDDPRLLKTGGDLGLPIEQGSFAVKKVEDAVWATPEGQVTEIIDDGDAFYIAQVTEKKPGKGMLPFEDDAVQTKILETLRTRQFREMRQTEQEKLVKDAVVRSDESMMNIAVEMAMQNYSRWSEK